MVISFPAKWAGPIGGLEMGRLRLAASQQSLYFEHDGAYDAAAN